MTETQDATEVGTARVEEAIRFNPARLYTYAEARALMLGPDAPREQMPTENWLMRQGGLGNFETVQLGRARYLKGEQILKLIKDREQGRYGRPVHGDSARRRPSR